MEKTKTRVKNLMIGVLMGGMSSERDVSICSGTAVYKALKKKGYKAVAIDVNRDAANVIKKKRIDIAFITLHGRYGEDGTIQGLLEIMGIPYTGSGLLASAIAFDKAFAKEIFRTNGIPTPAWEVVKKGGKGARGKDFPVVVKPSRQGSTIGLSLVKEENGFQKAVRKAFRYDDKVIIERFIHGREVTAGILNGEPLPVVEIKPKKGLYDYRSKYTKGMTDYIAPAPLDKEIERKIKDAALNGYNVLGCRGAARVDIMLDMENNPYVLEVNTIPGMTELSLLPKAAACIGMGFPELVEKILLDVKKR